MKSMMFLRNQWFCQELNDLRMKSYIPIPLPQQSISFLNKTSVVLSRTLVVWRNIMFSKQNMRVYLQNMIFQTKHHFPMQNNSFQSETNVFVLTKTDVSSDPSRPCLFEQKYWFFQIFLCIEKTTLGLEEPIFCL